MLPSIFIKSYARCVLWPLARSRVKQSSFRTFTYLHSQLNNYKDVDDEAAHKHLNSTGRSIRNDSGGDKRKALQKYNDLEENKDFDRAIKKLKNLVKDQENLYSEAGTLNNKGNKNLRNKMTNDDAVVDEQQKSATDSESETHTENVSVEKTNLPLKDKVTSFIRSVINGENFRQLKEELTKFSKTRARKQEKYKQSISNRLGQDVTELKKSIGIASRVVNDVTGYSKVNALKEKIAKNDLELKVLREEITRAKDDFSTAIEKRSESQREMNDLLERKSSWVPTDLKRFTELYMNEHELEREVKLKKIRLDELDQKNDETHDNLIKSIMDRYHEEQVWSDKIRQFSTWGTVLIMVCNLLLVFLVQLVFEPFKRYRLVRSFENKVRDIFDRNEEMESDLKKLKNDMDSGYDTLLGKIEENQQNIVEKLPEQNITARILPDDLSFVSIKHWIHFTFGKLLNPLHGSGSETFTMTGYDIQYFVYFFSSLLLLTGCFLGRLL